MTTILGQDEGGSFQSVVTDSYRDKRIDDFHANQPQKDLAKG